MLQLAGPSTSLVRAGSVIRRALGQARICSGFPQVPHHIRLLLNAGSTRPRITTTRGSAKAIFLHMVIIVSLCWSQLVLVIANGTEAQCMWYSTTKIGMGAATDSDGNTYVVARYFPPGNFSGEKPY